MWGIITESIHAIDGQSSSRDVQVEFKKKYYVLF
jgi:hypothetical protein